MKKVLFFGVLVGSLLTSSIAFADQAIKLIVNGVDITPNMEAKPIIVDGRTYVPARPLVEALGATVSWDNNTNSVIVTGSNSEGKSGEVGLWEKKPIATTGYNWDFHKDEKVISTANGGKQGSITFDLDNVGIKPVRLKGTIIYENTYDGYSIIEIFGNGESIYKSNQLKGVGTPIQVNLPVEHFSNVTIQLHRYNKDGQLDASGYLYLTLSNLRITSN
ncbi:hypothetical protein GTO89_14065 [Heliobacterium gestii]|uniref:Copper amine oxidase-like N-terminal domain-containing protein n=1 Tax=Heliomicrobium gestii TaxID=2699 RepID=A0A845LHV7_HELGE|nr:copper amine oxidase N-terminal domain-containing protein [Heliomicrobium gestii]MBM7867766.1 hypothetical protein [Heliomicrobium gestii]MZP44159.1 hypothetical protein [Heliomicrobium gestii]